MHTPPPDNPPASMRVLGDLVVAPRVLVPPDVACTRSAALGEHAVAQGDLHVAGTLVVAPHARIEGQAVVGGDVEWSPLASAAALRSEGALRVGGAVVARRVEARRGVAPRLAQESEEARA